MITLREYLKTAKIGEKIKLNNNCEILVIDGNGIEEKFKVNHLAALILDYYGKDKHVIARGILSSRICLPCKCQKCGNEHEM